MGVKYVAKKDRVLVGFRERRNPFLAEINSCAVMHPLVGTRLVELGEMIKSLTMRDKIPQIEVAMGDEKATEDKSNPSPEGAAIFRKRHKSCLFKFECSLA